MKDFDIKTASMADLYAARQYCSGLSETLRKVDADEYYKEATLYSILCMNISEEINTRLSPAIEQIKETLSK